MKQTRQALRAIKQSIFLDVYDRNVYVYGGPLYGNKKIQKCAVPFEATKAG
jgi:hypothetical protein